MGKGLFYYLAKRVGYAIGDFGLIEEGDRILIGVSGGKDSLALLDFMIDKQKKSPVKFEIFAYHVSLDEENKALVEEFLQKRGVDFAIDEDTVKELDLGNASKSPCFICSWNRRKAIFLAAEKYNCNKVAFGHNMDDVVQTYLMNVFFQGTISAMCPKQSFFNGQITVIRPLVYIKEDELKRLAKEKGYPLMNECEWAQENHREEMKYILSYLRKRNRGVDIVKNAFLSLMNINPEYLPKRIGGKEDV